MSEFKVVQIHYDGGIKSIICQGKNGSCALVAVINYLVLRHDVCIKDEVGWEQIISEEKLLEIIENSLVVLNGERFKDRVFKNEFMRGLPVLATPADVIPYTNSITGFGRAAVLNLIDALCIPVLHGFMVDDEDPKTAGLRGCSYTDLMNAYNSPPLPEDADDVKKRWELIRDIMEKTKNQLTSYGISCICDYMISQRKAFAILYRNGEFKLVHLYRGVVHLLYTLDEDTEIELEERTRVWQLLSDVDRDGLYVTGKYKHLNEEDSIIITQLYLKGWRYERLLPKLIADRYAAELIESEKREKEEKAKKEAAARSKTKKSQAGGNSESVAANEESSPPAPCSEIGDITGAILPDEKSFPSIPSSHEGDNSGPVSPVGEASMSISSPQEDSHYGAVSSDGKASPPISSHQEDNHSGAVSSPNTCSQSLAFKLFHNFLENSHYCGRSKTPYFEGEVMLMKERNLFMLSIDYSHIKEDCQELSILICDDYDNSIREDLKKCLVEYLMGKSVEKEMAEQAVLKILEVPEVCQPFIEFAERNQRQLIDYHVIYQKELSACASKLGRRMARAFLKTIKDMHISGYCWNGGWSASDMKVRCDGEEIVITAKAQHLVYKEGIEADLKKFSEILFPYYTYEIEVPGKETTKEVLPSYFLKFKEDCEDVPDPVSKPEELTKFYRFLLSHAAFMDPLSTATLTNHLYTVCDSLLGTFEFVYAPLQNSDCFTDDWIKAVQLLSHPFTRVLTHFGRNYYQRGYWFLLKYLRNFLEHMLRNTKNEQPILDLMSNSMMMGHYMSNFVTNLIRYIVMHFDIEDRFKTPWTHFEDSK